ncbi:MAG: TetR/AcrR family transcriptional regulator [Bacteroidales bacterium]|nr:TetR/AcrR family transcriptional regulator [Bacteroidales bacterium]MCF8386605.1 TetR/AcrR family transcriptional regulator [Bacteroidales bacterium]MCF8397721.1 TetR/AcrR family transcriptional regulator [Bacteroidales bacterium]
MGISERKEREKQQRRTEIVNAAEKVFFTQGFKTATMDQVAEEAELSKGTLYLYFKSKEELHFAINMRAGDIMYEYFSKAIHTNQNGLENTRNIGMAYIEFVKYNPKYFESIMHFQIKNVDDFISGSEYFKEHKKKNPLKLFIGVIEEGIKDGSIRSDIKPEIISHTLWAMATGVFQHMSSKKLHMMKHDTDKEIDPEEYLQSFFQIIRNGISHEK